MGWPDPSQPGTGVADDLVSLKKMKEDKLKRLGLPGDGASKDAMIDMIDDPGKGPDRGRLRTRPIGLSGLSPNQVRTLSGRELELARRIGTEKAYGVAKDGSVVVEREGEEDRIIFDEDELARLAGCVLTHNHPSGRSFSLADIQLATQYQLDEIRSITRNYVFRVRPPKEGWPAWETKIYPMIAEALRQATRQIISDTERYHWSESKTNQERQHAFIQALSKLCGFRYHREEE